ncbi:MAG: NUDIX domain-containing protein [Flavobacterium sp.]|uniref:NUDIX domain-containing protein n=1 Tax=Flavobacterium sp. TaxID=239 RepID=UPI00120A9822|nr:NUDIX domain-containing protein [Flavobacterium sp.]RZJ65864.1 MAG: NUDIX domain-containing protein [Flavobacterium sp.]
MKQSAGILLYQKSPLRFFLVHPGGPFWKNKDLGAWSIPKGEFTSDEDPLLAAIREFFEETGHKLDPDDAFFELRAVTLKSGKKVWAWALEKFVDSENITSNEFEIEWPPRTGRKLMIPEVDKAAWLETGPALEKINEAQRDFIEQIRQSL